MLIVHHLAQAALPNDTCKFTGRDFTLPQLFACLVLKEHHKRSYRGGEAQRRGDSCGAIGMVKVPITTRCTRRARRTREGQT